MTFFPLLMMLSGITPPHLSPPAGQDTTAYMIVQSPPEFTGGREAMFRFIQQNSRYPVVPPDKHAKGKLVHVQVLIGQDGSISRPVIHYSEAEARYEQEALRIVGLMQKWRPGSQDGRVLRVYTQIPFRFVAVHEKP